MANMAVVTPTTTPIIIRSILFATDFSTTSDRALKYALAIAREFPRGLERRNN